MSTNSEPKPGMQTPWGRADSVEVLAAGIWAVGTPGHGGIKLDRSRNAKMPSYMRNQGGWYEEDCEVYKVMTVFSTDFPETARESAKKGLKNWYPNEYEAFYGEALLEGDSFVRDQASFSARHKDDFVVLAAWGDSKEGVPKGMVGVVASPGGVRGRPDEEVYFLVPATEYENRGPHGFVVDPSIHKRTTPIR